MKEISIKQSQEIVDKWINEVGVRYFSELTNMAILTEEVGEVARIMSRKYGEQSFKKSDQGDLADELADVLYENLGTPKLNEMASFIQGYKHKFSWDYFVDGIETIYSRI